MIIAIDTRLTMRVGEKKKSSNAAMNKTTAVGEQFGTSDFLCGC